MRHGSHFSIKSVPKDKLKQVPCASCSASAEAIGLLSMSLQTAIRAARYLRIPLPDIAPATQSFRLHAVPTEEIPKEFKKICEQYGYHLVDVNNTVAIPQPNADATNESPISPPAPQLPSSQFSNAISIHSSSTDGSPVSPPAPQLPSSQFSDAISIHSLSTDWEEEYGVTVTPLSSDAATISSSDATAAPSPIFPSVDVAPTDAHAEDQERWYAVIVGRKPGIYSGSHNVTSNVSEVPGRFARRYSTQELAQAAYNEALDAGQVIEVTYIISKRALSRPSVQ